MSGGDDSDKILKMCGRSGYGSNCIGRNSEKARGFKALTPVALSAVPLRILVRTLFFDFGLPCFFFFLHARARESVGGRERKEREYNADEEKEKNKNDADCRTTDCTERFVCGNINAKWGGRPGTVLYAPCPVKEVFSATLD
ncbi:unnamed protein product [Calypogeia fissa]